MSKVDRSIVIAGLTLFLLSCLYLPMEITRSGGEYWPEGWYWITRLAESEYSGRARVDFTRLVLEWLAIAALLAIARLTEPWRKQK